VWLSLLLEELTTLHNSLSWIRGATSKAGKERAKGRKGGGRREKTLVTALAACIRGAVVCV